MLEAMPSNEVKGNGLTDFEETLLSCMQSPSVYGAAFHVFGWESMFLTEDNSWPQSLANMMENVRRNVDENHGHMDIKQSGSDEEGYELEEFEITEERRIELVNEHLNRLPWQITVYYYPPQGDDEQALAEELFGGY